MITHRTSITILLGCAVAVALPGSGIALAAENAEELVIKGLELRRLDKEPHKN